MEHRAYFFTNMYISDIQRGIQTAHCISDMHRKYNNISLHESILINSLEKWADIDKTMIVLNGGYSSHLVEIIEILQKDDQFPFDFFRESKEALNTALTCVGVILPEFIYETSMQFRSMTESEQVNVLESPIIAYDNKDFGKSNSSNWLIQNLANYRLA